jgi:hypothetical protein
MRMTIGLRRAARRSVGLLVGTLLLTAPAVVLASHQFPDVTNSNPFHDDIDAIADAGITAGFADGGYHPSDPVTRQAMAAFMHRGFGRVGLATGQDALTNYVTVAATSYSGDFVPVRQLTIVVPGATNSFDPKQLVYLHGEVVFLASFTESRGCPCTFKARIVDATTGSASFEQQRTFEDVNGHYSFGVEAVYTASPGARLFYLEVSVFTRLYADEAASFGLTRESSLSAMSFPFGPTGTNTVM